MDRITNVIQKTGFYTVLDQPFKDGGVGLNSVTAKDITEEIELILILGFGIVKINPQDIEGLDSENNNQDDQGKNKATESEKNQASLPADSAVGQTEKKLIAAATVDLPSLAEDNQAKNIKHNFLDGMQKEEKNISDLANKIPDADDQMTNKKENQKNESLDEDTSLQDAIFAAQERERQLKEAVKTNKNNDGYF